MLNLWDWVVAGLVSLWLASLVILVFLLWRRGARLSASEARLLVLRNERRFRVITEAISDIIWSANSAGIMVEPQERWELYTGQSQGDYLGGRGWLAALHPEDRERASEVWMQSVRSLTPYSIQARIWSTRHQTYRHCEMRAVALMEGAVCEGWTGTVSDITDRITLDEERKWEARRKDEFIAMLAHELRNPLSPVLSAIHIVRHVGTQDARGRASLDMIERQTKNMGRMIDDLLDVSRITKGKFQLSIRVVCLQQILRDVVAGSEPKCEEKQQHLEYHCPQQNLYIRGDEVRLQQVFGNILNNARKYTERGGTISVGCIVQGGNAVIRISDTGQGIADSILPHIFEMFFQAERVMKTSEGGLGIGLTLVKRLTEMHGGSVMAQSPGLGKGSTFTVRLPLTEEEGPEVVEAGAEVPVEAKKILVVDDNQDSAASLAGMLEIVGFQAYTAHDGEEGVALARSLRPDVILFDIGMPKLDGYGACEMLRRDASFASVGIIAVTGFGTEADKAKAMKYGFDHHLTKPASPEEVMGAIQHVLNVRRTV